MKRLAFVAAALAMACGAARALETPPILADRPDSGWWIVVGSGLEPGVDHPSIAGAVNAAAARCGFSTFNDFSAKFSGFKPGYEVFVIGAYGSKPEAERRLKAVRPCIPSAYLKFGTYAGE